MPPIYHAIILCHCKLCFPYISKVVPTFTVHLDNLVHITPNYRKDAAFKRGTSTYYLQIYPLFVTKILFLECTDLFLTILTNLLQHTLSLWFTKQVQEGLLTTLCIDQSRPSTPNLPKIHTLKIRGPSTCIRKPCISQILIFRTASGPRLFFFFFNSTLHVCNLYSKESFFLLFQIKV